MNRKVAPVIVEWCAQIEFDHPHGVFQLAALVLGADRAPVGDRHVALADVLRSAKFDPVAGQAPMRMFGHQKLDDIFAKLLDLRGVRHAHRIGHRGCGAGGDRHLAAVDFDLDHACPTRALWLHFRVVAQVGNVDFLIERRLQNRMARLCDNVAAIDREGNSIGHAEISER